MYYIIRV